MVKKREKIYIHINGENVGQLIYESNGSMTLFYDKKWLINPKSRPLSLSLPLTERKYTGQIVYNFFDNLLPNNNEIRARIQAKFNINSSQPFKLLQKIGSECVGAIHLSPEKNINTVKKIKYKILNNNEISKILKNLENTPLGMTNLKDDDFRISLAGVQEKTAFTLIDKKWCRPIGNTPTTHIFKKPIGRIRYNDIDLSDSCENEWLCLNIFKAFNIPVANSKIQYFEDEKVLIVERFDRKFSNDKSWIIRLPVEDMCQALGFSPHLKYEADGGPGMKEIMNILLGSRTANYDRKIFMKSQILFWLIAAIDGHAKNFSIFLEPNNRFTLAPLYDILSAYPYFKSSGIQEQKVKMAMAFRGKNTHYKWIEILPRHFISNAKKVGYSSQLVEEILEEIISESNKALTYINSKLPNDFPKYIYEPILNNLTTNLKKLG